MKKIKTKDLIIVKPNEQYLDLQKLVDILNKILITQEKYEKEMHT